MCGPLHSFKINPGGDTAENWICIIDDLYHRATGKRLKRSATLPIKEAMSFLEVIGAAWLYLRGFLAPILRKKRTISACSFLYWLDNTVPLSLYMYEIIIKNSDFEGYLTGLAFSYQEVLLRDRKNYKKALLYLLNMILLFLREDHPALSLLRNNLCSVDEAKNEGGIISRLAHLMKSSLDTEQSINKSLRFFAARMNEDCDDLKEKLGSKNSHQSGLFSNQIDNIFSHAVEMMLDIFDALMKEQSSDIQFFFGSERVCKKKGDLCVTFVSKAMFNEKLCIHTHASPSFALFPMNFPVPNHCIGCNASINVDTAVNWLCGCSFCRNCNPLTCRCMSASCKRLTDAATLVQNDVQEKITVDSLKMTGEGQKKKKSTKRTMIDEGIIACAAENFQVKTPSVTSLLVRAEEIALSHYAISNTVEVSTPKSDIHDQLQLQTQAVSSDQCQYIFPKGHKQVGQRCTVMKPKYNGFCGWHQQN